MGFRRATIRFGSRDYLSQFCRKGQIHEALDAVSVMHQKGVPINRDVIYCLIQGCAKTQDLGAASRLYTLMIARGLHTLDFLAGHLIRVFTLCGSLSQAINVFDCLAKPTVHSWNAIIWACSTLDDNHKALELFNRMQHADILPDSITLQGVLKECINMGLILEGHIFHGLVIETGLESDVALKNTLINMYAKCGHVSAARSIFDRIADLTLVSWGSMISCYTMCGDSLQALELFQQMGEAEVAPNAIIFSLVIKASGQIMAIREGRLIHHQVIKCGLQSNVAIGNTLVHFYINCGHEEEAYNVFRSLPHRTQMSWGALAGSGKYGLSQFFSEECGITPNRPILLNLLKACSRTGSLKQGKLVHDCSVRNGMDSDHFIGTSLVDMYAQCGDLYSARHMFDMLPYQSIVSWNVMIFGYVVFGHGLQAFRLLKQMLDNEIQPDRGIFHSVLKACIKTMSIYDAKLIHSMTIESDFDTDILVESTLVELYAKCGLLREARSIFQHMSDRDVVLWAAIISGFVENGFYVDALNFYSEMQLDGTIPNGATFVCILETCTNLGAMKDGKLVHFQIVENGLESENVIGNGLLEMYIEFRLMDDAYRVFEQLQHRDIFSWSMMMGGYALSGKHELVYEYLEEMPREGIKPDDYMFTYLLTACSRSGYLYEGVCYFQNMIKKYKITPTIEHYTCMTDLFGRVGWLKQAKDLLCSVPFNPSSIMWTSLLTNSKFHGNVDTGSQCFYCG